MILKLYPTNPNPRYVKMILECLADGGTIIFPTDTLYGLGGCINNPRTFERICQIKGIKKEKANFSFIFHDLSMLSEFTKPINNDVFKMMKRNLPGAFTFILEANNNIPRIFQSKKKTIGIRIPDQPIITNIVREFGAPIMTTSLSDEEDEINPYLTDPEEIHDRYKDLVDIVIDGGAGENEESTVVDCTDNEIVIVRQGKGLLDE
jgi:tRNA threonylcarbamoyl adenosine modification protein (Sua5/YciO/YrdC/YwlC family)